MKDKERATFCNILRLVSRGHTLLLSFSFSFHFTKFLSFSKLILFLSFLGILIDGLIMVPYNCQQSQREKKRSRSIERSMQIVFFRHFIMFNDIPAHNGEFYRGFGGGSARALSRWRCFLSARRISVSWRFSSLRRADRACSQF